MTTTERRAIRADINRIWDLIGATFPSLRQDVQRLRRRSRR
jgi:hypothetical protein